MSVVFFSPFYKRLSRGSSLDASLWLNSKFCGISLVVAVLVRNVGEGSGEKGTDWRGLRRLVCWGGEELDEARRRGDVEESGGKRCVVVRVLKRQAERGEQSGGKSVCWGGEECDGTGRREDEQW